MARSGGSQFFPVVHPQKLKVRLVFDSSVVYHGTSLNEELLQGLDQNNYLRGVLMRFREGKIGYMADVEAMFHSFFLNPEHRDFLQFYWYRNKNPEYETVQYRAKVHVFGNRPSPAIATYGLRHAADSSHTKAITKNFIHHSYYVDDGFGCADTVTEAVSVLEEGRSVLAKFNIRRHKIVSSSQEFLKAFPDSEKAQELAQVDFDDAPMQRTLGVVWDNRSDSFLINVHLQNRPFTKRGVLSVINSIFDPPGIASPVTLEGKLILRTVISSVNKPDDPKYGWDDPLPTEYLPRWESWKRQLTSLSNLKVPRGFIPKEFGTVIRRELCVFRCLTRCYQPCHVHKVSR